MLARVRVARGLTQEELAEAIGISLPTYRRLERKDMDNPCIRHLVNAALALGVELDLLIEDEWCEWMVFDDESPAPPRAEEFWRRPFAPGQAQLKELRQRGHLSEPPSRSGLRIEPTNRLLSIAVPKLSRGASVLGMCEHLFVSDRLFSNYLSCCPRTADLHLMPALRFQPPDRLGGATAFARDDAVRGSMNMVRLVKRNRWLWRELRKTCDLDHRYGRRRERGNWELVAVAFVVSDYVDIQPWHDDSTDSLWQACGFAHKPSYRTTWRRLRELATVADEFLDAAGRLIRRARSQDPRVLAPVHFDNTKDETHAALVHDCEPGKCPAKQAGSSARGGRAGAGVRPARQDTKAFREERHQLAALAPEQGTDDKTTDVEIVRRGSRMIKRIRIDGCWYRTLDLDAGIRAYMGPRGAKRFWHGYYSCKATDHFTGGVIPLVESASRQEYDLFDDHSDLVRDLLGEAPETAIGDKGFSVQSVFRK